VIAGHLAEAGIEQGIREIVGNGAFVTLAEDGLLTFYTRDRVELPRLARTDVALSGGTFSYRITDESSLMNLNTFPPARLDALLHELDIDKRTRDTILDSLQDWRDGNENHRLNGAESDDYYLKLPVPYRARNGNLESINELLQIKGVTPEIFKGVDDKPGLAAYVTVRATGPVNVNTASPVILRAVGLSGAEVLEIEAARRQSPYTTVPPRFSGRGLGATTRTFRLEAEGKLDGRVRARARAIVQLRGDPTTPSVVVLEWSGIQ
jgi:general secretion pathway protein K